ncbi:ankyrin repeat-containing protein At5g02620-like [Triticum dicoccoides]|uniref:ankyrin repeat-containing protein At5g02620-like n=1 Tax=Triticum dicoccoides TaxID=85692 RepID=UPI000E790418|nr:ankyrin repeat-containing protein At5g02620-like [Triticum dicoccoides]
MDPARAAQAATRRKKMTKQLTGKRDDTALHGAARAGLLVAVQETLSGASPEELRALLSKQNTSGETPLFVAAEYGYVALVNEMVKYHDVATAGIKARSGYDALHIAAKQGDVEVVKELLQALPELAMTVDASNTTALNTAATQGHMEVVRLLLEVDGTLALIARSNGKTALHSAARNGHVQVVRALLEAEPSIALRVDKKGQTALHMAAKGTNLDLVDALLAADPSLLNLPDNKGNTALHIASRKARHQIIKRLLELPDTNLKAINRAAETPLDTAEKMGNGEVAGVLTEHGVQSARALSPTSGGNPARELKQQVSDIKHEVHSQLEQTRQTRVRMQGIQKRINKLHEEGLNNAINSTTVVAVLIATVAFAAIFTVPGEYVDAASLGPGQELGEANIAHQTPFIIFFVFDSVALFISLAVVVVQTSVVVIERKAKKQMMAVINKLMWVACVLISVAFLALSFVVVGRAEQWLAVAVTIMGATILVTTIGTMLYWVIAHRLEAKRMRNIKRSSMSRSRSHSGSGLSEHEWVDEDFKKMYAI